MEQVMLDQPNHWQNYYTGIPAHQKLQRHFSYSDRIRYYWSAKTANDAVTRLLGHFGDTRIPDPLISQFLCKFYEDVVSGALAPTAPAILRASVSRVLDCYSDACEGK